MAWQDWLQTWMHGPPLQPVQGDPVNPGYRQMPQATSIDDRRPMAGPAQWASRPHDQDFRSTNMAGYWTVPSLDSIDWLKAHGWLDRSRDNTVMTMPPDPDYIPTDPSILARIRAAQDAKGEDW